MNGGPCCWVWLSRQVGRSARPPWTGIRSPGPPPPGGPCTRFHADGGQTRRTEGTEEPKCPAYGPAAPFALRMTRYEMYERYERYKRYDPSTPQKKNHHRRTAAPLLTSPQAYRRVWICPTPQRGQPGCICVWAFRTHTRAVGCIVAFPPAHSCARTQTLASFRMLCACGCMWADFVLWQGHSVFRVSFLLAGATRLELR